MPSVGDINLLTGVAPFAGEDACLESPDRFLEDILLPYCFAFYKLDSRICSYRDTGQLWFVELLLRMAVFAEGCRLALVLRCLCPSSKVLAETTGCSRGEAEVFYFSRLPVYLALFCFFISSTFCLAFCIS